MEKQEEVPDTPSTHLTDDLGISPTTTKVKLKSSSDRGDGDEENGDRDSSKKRRSSFSLSGIMQIRDMFKHSDSSSDLSNANEEEGDRNTSKKRRSFNLSGLLQMHFPDLATAASEEKKPQPIKKWKRGRASRKFSFASPEEYMQYASKRSLVSQASQKQIQRKEPEKEEPEKKEPEEEGQETEIPLKKDPEEKITKDADSKENSNRTNKNPSWSNNRRKYQSQRKFSFASAEEYLEYSSELMKVKERSAEFKKAKKRNTQSTEFETSAAFESLDATADVSLCRDATDPNSRGEEESVDLEANYADDNWRNNFRRRKTEEKRCFCRKLSFREVLQIIGIWVLIAVVSTLVARNIPEGNTDTSMARPIDSCSLCPLGTSIQQSQLEVVLSDFTCASVDLFSNTTYTCGEIQNLLLESSSECSEKGSCPGLQEAASQCCFRDSRDNTVDKTVTKQITQTGHAIDQLHMISF